MEKLAELLGYSLSFIEKIEYGIRHCGMRFSLRFMTILRDDEKLQFLDLTTQWFEEINPKREDKAKLLALRKLREKKRLSEVTADDLALLVADGFEIDGELKNLFKEKPTEKRKRGKKRHS